MRYGAYDVTYEEYYGIPKDTLNNKTPSLTFSNILNEIKPIKNLNLLKQIYKSYKQSTTKSNKGSKKESKKI